MINFPIYIKFKDFFFDKLIFLNFCTVFLLISKRDCDRRVHERLHRNYEQ
jgi:hypothetical protein